MGLVLTEAFTAGNIFGSILEILKPFAWFGDWDTGIWRDSYLSSILPTEKKRWDGHWRVEIIWEQYIGHSRSCVVVEALSPSAEN